MKDTLNVKLGQHRVRYSIISSDDQWQVLRWIAVYGDWEADPSYLPKYNDKRKAFAAAGIPLSDG